MGNEFHHFIAGWDNAEMILALTQSTRKCLKFQYLCQIEYDFQKSRVKSAWDQKDSVSAKKIKYYFMLVCLED